jgi:tetratricopeptide (TPR) repeat protein
LCEQAICKSQQDEGKKHAQYARKLWERFHTHMRGTVDTFKPEERDTNYTNEEIHTRCKHQHDLSELGGSVEEAKALQERLRAALAELQGVKEENEAAAHANGLLQKQNDQYKASEEKLEKALSETIEENRANMLAKTKAENGLAAARASQQGIEDRCDEAVKRAAKAKADFTKADEERAAAESRLEKAEDDLSDLRRDTKKMIQAARDEVDAELSKAKAEARAARRENEEAEEVNAKLRRQNETLMNEIELMRSGTRSAEDDGLVRLETSASSLRQCHTSHALIFGWRGWQRNLAKPHVRVTRGMGMKRDCQAKPSGCISQSAAAACVGSCKRCHASVSKRRLLLQCKATAPVCLLCEVAVRCVACGATCRTTQVWGVCESELNLTVFAVVVRGWHTNATH